MKQLFIATCFLLLLAACSSLRPSGASASSSAAKREGSVEFLNDISITPQGHTDKVSSNESVYTAAPGKRSRSSLSTGIEILSPLKFKYAIILNEPVENLGNERLLSYIDDWYGTKYRYGGSNREGIDCSAFSGSLMSIVYGINLPRMAKDQYHATKRIQKIDLQEGDLVFFHTMGRKKNVSHVGVYLSNNKFVHASISGVEIDDLGEGYYHQHYIGAGRPRDLMASK